LDEDEALLHKNKLRFTILEGKTFGNSKEGSKKLVGAI
jgi:hypothetical protein